VLFCHGTPRRDDEVILQSGSQEHLAAALAGVRERTGWRGAEGLRVITIRR
jgi:hypothetical protein